MLRSGKSLEGGGEDCKEGLWGGLEDCAAFWAELRTVNSLGRGGEGRRGGLADSKVSGQVLGTVKPLGEVEDCEVLVHRAHVCHVAHMYSQPCGLTSRTLVHGAAEAAM